MKKILVLCTGNSCRSQIAEGYLKAFARGKAEVFSAGIESHGVNPRAVNTMLQDGLDISGQTSNMVSEYLGINFDYVITVCDNAKERCPVFSSDAITIHQSFPDPAKAAGSEEDIVSQFALVRDEIKSFCKLFAERYL